ncbi:MAG TPA: universal stress protein [Deltaproteobacteria bacterium]|nr:MAG: hypothetical protein DRG83_03990 [Deltaproteobacteria bacterium]RLB09614.1 MAG: hypothetical protein DRG59_01830 [Deltaproteobacteria bacterium]HDM75431.1 universal stress protein [Deltaproteobacteria bacterium]HEC31368.1 universal stress protein [Deltaproteobacteria bacterium]
MHEKARETVNKNASEQGKVLVATYGRRFSRMVIGYSIGFAERMGMEIIVVKVDPIDIEYTKTLGEYTNVLSEKFKEKADEEIWGFKKSAGEKGICFRHVVKSYI